MLNRLKRILAMALTLLMCINMMPVSALAETVSDWMSFSLEGGTASGETNNVETIQVGGTVNLMGDGWSSSNTSIIEITGREKRTATGKGVGFAVLTKSGNGMGGGGMPPGFDGNSTRYVFVVPTLSISGDKDLKIGTAASLTLTESSSALTGHVTWTSSNESVVTVSGNGSSAVLTPKANGNATITASVVYTYTYNGKTYQSAAQTATYEVTVKGASAQIASKKTINIYAEDTDAAMVLDLKVTDAEGATTTSYTVAWTSDDESIIAIEGGKLVLHDLGTVNVHAAVTVGDKTLDAVSCAVTVTGTCVTLNVNGEKTPVAVNRDGSVTVPETVAAPEGYIITGWAATKGGTEALDLITAKFTEDTTLYAILKEIHTVNYYTWDFETNKYIHTSETVEHNDEITLPELKDAQPYILMGWTGNNRTEGTIDYAKSLTTFVYESDDTVKVDRNMNFYSLHRAQGAIFYDAQNTVHSSSFNAETGEIIAPVKSSLNYDRAGWEHVGWTANSSTLRLEANVENVQDYIVSKFEDGHEYNMVLRRRTFTITFAEEINEAGEAVNVIAQKTYAYGDEVGNPNISDASGFIYAVGAQKDGKYFYGWSPVITSVSGDQIVTPIWRDEAIGENQHVVTFLVNGEIYATLLVNHNEKIAAMPANPVSEDTNAVFMGWLKPNGEAFVANNPIVENMTLIADFKTGYLVRYIVGDKVYASETVKLKDGRTTAPQIDPAQDGYEFMGWRLEGAAKDFDFTQEIKGDTNLYARFSDVDYLFYVANGGTENAPFKYVVDEKTAFEGELPKSTRVGYEFKGWFWSDKDGNITGEQVETASQINAAFEAANKDTKDDTDLYLVAKWEAKLVPVTVVVWNQKSVPDRGNSKDENKISDYNARQTTYTVYAYPETTISVDENGNLTTNTANGKSGVYANANGNDSFKVNNRAETGFKYSGIGDAEGGAVTVQPSGTVLNVFYKRIHYKLVFNLGSGKMTDTEDNNKEYSGENYYFTAEMDEDISAKWPYQGSTRFTFDFGKSTFYGWNGMSVTQVSMIRVLSKDIIGYAKNTDNVQTITLTASTISNSYNFYLMYAFDTLIGETPNKNYGGTEYTVQKEYSQFAKSGSDDYGQKAIAGVTKLTDLDKQTEWSNLGFEDTISEPTERPDGYKTEDGTLYYKLFLYNRNKHTITLNMNDLAAVDNDDIPADDYTPSIDSKGEAKYGSYSKKTSSDKDTTYTLSNVRFGENLKYVIPSNEPTRGAEGQFEFTGWYLDPGCNDKYTGGTMPDSDITLYAGWKINPVKVEYYLSEGKGAELFSQALDIPSGNKAPELKSNPANSLQYGQFEGWYYYPIDNNAWKAEFKPGETIVYKNTEVYAQWKTTNFTVTYVSESDSGEQTWKDPLFYDLRTQLTLADIGNITNGDKVFVGWAEEGNEKHLRQPGSIYRVYYDVTFVAVWKDKADANTVIYHNNFEPEKTHNQYVLKGANVNVQKNMFEREGYRFLYWTTDAAGSGTKYYGGNVVSANVAFPNGATEFHLYAQWEALEGSLKIVKQIENLPADKMSDDQFTFTIVDNASTDGASAGTVTLNLNNHASETIKLPVGTYTVTESSIVAMDGNKAKHAYAQTTPQEVTIKAGEEKTVTFTNVAEDKTTISGTKTWDDADNQDGKRPTSIKVTLTGAVDKETVSSDSKTVSASDGWKYSFTDLPKYKDGKEITYSVTEDDVEGYTTTVDGYNITNSHTPETIDISGTKTWDDADNQDGKRPTSIKVHLYADGVEVANKEVTANDNWSYSFTGMPVNANGKAITYTVSEDKVEGYTATVNGYNITNSQTPATTTISGTKTWNDADNQDGKRPTSITVKLLANGEDTGKTETANAASDWKYSFTDLPEYEEGKVGAKITYSVTEEAVEGYEAAYKATKDGFDITNTHEIETITISGTKTWDDANNQDGIRPTSITVKLLANGEDTGKTETANAASDWKYSFTDLPEYEEGKVGAKITYSVTEEAVEGYEAAYKATKDGFDITNTHEIETITISGTKTWDDANNQDGKRPDSITVRLYADGTEVKTATVEANADGNWMYSFTNLPKYKEGENGKEIVYSITEDAVKGYTTKVEGYSITNTRMVGHLTVEKTTTSTAKNGKTYALDEKIKYEIVVKNDGNLTITNIAVTDELTGDTWTIESLAPGESSKAFTAEHVVTEEDIRKGKVVNVATATGTSPDPYNPKVPVEPGTTEDPTDEFNPAYTVVKVLAEQPKNGKFFELGETAKFTITVTNTGNVTLKNITVKEELAGATFENGTAQVTIDSLKPGATTMLKAQYTITEADLGNKDLKNMLTSSATTPNPDPEKPDVPVDPDPIVPVPVPVDDVKSVSGKKIWEDSNNKDGVRPESITVNLLADGEKIKTATVKADANGDWSYSFERLPMHKDGKEIVYTITEDAVKGYTTKVEGYNITNTRMVGHLTVEKTTTSTAKNGKTYALGEKIKYEIVVKNDGNLTITNIAVTDELTGDTWTIESLAPGESSKAFTAEHVVTEEDIRKGKVVNVATATGTSPDPYNPEVPVDPGTKEDPTDEFNPAYTVVKVLAEQPKNGEFFELGETAKFTITVTNTGNVTLKNITVKEELAGATFEDGTAQVTIDSLKPGATTMLKAQYTITEADLGNKDLKNLLTSSATTPNPDPEKPDVPVEPDPIIPAPIPVDDAMYTLTIRYWHERIGGKVAAETFTRSYRLKDSYSVTSPKLRGYSVDQDVVSGEITGDMQFDVIYTPNEYRVVIKYVYEDGTPAAPSYRDTVRNGDKYDVKSPTLDGYTPSKKRVTGVINGRDVVYTVIYVPTTTIIDDYGVPLNIGSVTMNAGDCFE